MLVWLIGCLVLLGMQFQWRPTRGGLHNPYAAWIFIWVTCLFAWITLKPIMFAEPSLGRIVPIQWVLYPVLPTMICWTSLLVVDLLVRSTDTHFRWLHVAKQCGYLAGVLAVYGWAQYLWIDPLELGPRSGTWNLTQNSAVTVFGNHMLTANFLAICGPLCLMLKPKRFLVIFAVIFSLLCLIHSAVSLVAFLAGTMVFLALQRRWRWVLSLGVLVLLGSGVLLMQTQTFFSPEGRVSMWYVGIQTLKANPLNFWLGFGLGTVEDFALRGAWIWKSFHSEPFQIMFETGIVGLCLVLGAMGHLVHKVWNTSMNTNLAGWVAAAVSFGIVSCFSFPLRIGSLLMLGVLIWASLEAQTEGV